MMCNLMTLVDLNLLTISSQLSDSIVTNANGHIESPVSMTPRPRPATQDRSTQTEPALPGQDTGQKRVPLPKRAESLQLEDAFPSGKPLVEGTLAKLHRVPGCEEEDKEEEEKGGGEQEKELSWTSSVEEPIQPTTIRCLQRDDCQDRSCSPEELASPSTSVRTSDSNLSSRSGPLSPIQEGEKKPLWVILPPSPPPSP